MNIRQYLLICLAEECAEVTQRVTKTLRFGEDEIQPGQDFDNTDRLSFELCDLVAIVELLQEQNIPLELDDREAIEAKKLKIAKFMRLSIDRGTLEVTS